MSTYFLFLQSIIPAMMVMSDLWGVRPTKKEQWRFALVECGALCVMTTGATLTQALSALSLASHPGVSAGV